MSFIQGPDTEISIHALREEGDRCCSRIISSSGSLFLSTPSARRATAGLLIRQVGQADFYPRPPRGGRRPSPSTTGHSSRHFYPRPPRGGRLMLRRGRARDFGISIHALREEGDCIKNRHPLPENVFLSTPSARRATPQAVRGHGGHQISIHALREEGDTLWLAAGCARPQFLSTPSARRATSNKTYTASAPGISIHALREEGDPAPAATA